MKLFNTHTHTEFSHDGKGNTEQLCREAEANSLFGFAVTDHCDCEYASDPLTKKRLDSSFLAAKAAQCRYSDKLIISCGVEIGEALFNPDFAENIINSHKWDVILGSVHAVRIPSLDMPFSIIDFSGFSEEMTDKYITQYFADELEMAKTADYDILTHLTVVLRYVVHKYKKNVDITKHYPVISEILKTVINRDKTLELNTSGLADGYIMPDREILEMYHSLGGKRITLGSDSHIPEKIASGLEEGFGILKETGFDTLTYYINRTPKEYTV